jgi:hypothetical protein
LRALELELLEALRQFIVLVARTLAIDLDASRTILQFALMTLGVFECGAHLRYLLPRLFFVALPLRQCFARGEQFLLVLRAIRCGLLAIGENANTVRFAFIRLELGALTASHRITLSLFRHGHLAANLLNMLALRRDKAQQLGPLAFRRGAL